MCSPAHLLVATTVLSALMACQASPSGEGGGNGHPNSGGTTGSGGAPVDAAADAGGGSGGASTATGGANAGTGGANTATGGVGAGGSGGAADAATGGAAGAGGSGGPGGVIGAGGRAGAGSGGAGGRGGQVGTCPFGSADQLIWSGVAPGGAGVTVREVVTERSTNPRLHDRTIAGVTKPSVLPYLAAKPNGAAAIVLPGGGYTHLAYDKEGTEIATWLNSVGVSAFVLKYRLPSDFPGEGWVALADAQRALRLIRKSAAACKIDPARIGVIGFSAGGHLASQLETRFSAQLAPAVDDVDAIDARPAFGVLVYPVISMNPAIAHAGSKTALLGANPAAAAVALASSELQVTATTPATFLGASLRDTTVKPDNSKRFDDALIAASVPQELHLYQDGGHGTGLNAPGDMGSWPAQCASWLTSSKFLSGPLP